MFESWPDVASKGIDALKNSVAQAAEVLKTATPQVWALAVRQVWIDGVECAVASVVFAVVAWWLWKRFWKFTVKHENHSYLEDYQIAGGIGCAIGFVAAVIHAVVMAVDALDFLGNPAYWTAMRILGHFGH